MLPSQAWASCPRSWPGSPWPRTPRLARPSTASTATRNTSAWVPSRCTSAATRCPASVAPAGRPSPGPGCCRATSGPTPVSVPVGRRLSPRSPHCLLCQCWGGGAPGLTVILRMWKLGLQSPDFWLVRSGAWLLKCLAGTFIRSSAKQMGEVDNFVSAVAVSPPNGLELDMGEVQATPCCQARCEGAHLAPPSPSPARQDVVRPPTCLGVLPELQTLSQCFTSLSLTLHVCKMSIRTSCGVSAPVK